MIYVDVRDGDGSPLVEAKWYPANQAAALLSHLIPQLHGPSAPVIGADWQPTIPNPAAIEPLFPI